MRRYSLTIVLAFAISLVVATSGAQAVVVSDQGSQFGVALVPGSRDQLQTAHAPAVQSAAPCTDPALSPEFTLPDTGLCYHGGPVIHKNETFALVWDPNPHKHYAASYVEQFLRDVADASGTLSSPYAATTQYTDASGRAGNTALYGGGFDDPVAYPASDCQVSGLHTYSAVGNSYDSVPNDVCLTDAMLKSELAAMVARNGLINRIQPGYTPVLVLLMPPGVETCLEPAAHLCSANSDASAVPAQFCSYHSQLTVGATVFNYVVQPWTAQTGCDEPDATKFTNPIDPQTLATDMGSRLVSPLSQAHMAAITDPALNGWSALDGSEINDNGCTPLGHSLDNATLGTSAQNPYLLAREFNNGGAIANDPFALPCTPSVVLTSNFVVPSAVNKGDVVEFDGSKSRSSLLVSNLKYEWDFGDGHTALGSSVVYSYHTAGTFTVTLKVTDRGGNVASLSQAIGVLGPLGPVGPPPPPALALRARLQLVPQSLASVFRSGVTVRVSTNMKADAIATLSISNATAQRAHIRAGQARSVVIGVGTISGIVAGSSTLHLRMSGATATKLKRVGHVTLTIRLALVAAGHNHTAIVVAGHY